MSKIFIVVNSSPGEVEVIATTSDIELYILDWDDIRSMNDGSRLTPRELSDRVIKDWRHSPKKVRKDFEKYIKDFIIDNS